MTDPIPALRRQLLQLDERHRRGELDDAAYERDKARLERELLDQVMAHEPPAAARKAAVGEPAPKAEKPERPSARMTALLATAVIVFAFAGYAVTGSPSHIFGAPPQSSADASGSPHEGEQFAAAVEKLAEKLKEQPDNFEGWAMLARSYVQLGRFDAAVPAYAKAMAIKGDDPRIIVDYADALAVTKGNNLEGEPMKLVERALKIEPDNPKGLALAGTAAFNAKNYKEAVRLWERLATVAPADSSFREQLQGSIAEARQLAGMPPAAMPAGTAVAQAMPAAPAAPTQSADTPPAAEGSGATITGSVRLAPALAAQAKPDDTVFVFARAAEGPRVPLAIVRKQVKDLPFEFSLTDAMAMSPAARMSMFPKIVVDARISKSGQAQPSAGDLEGRSGAVANTASGVVVEINQVVKN